ncbi:hypothetical protein [Hydrogenophaga luteola]|uniref:VOC domain-containing protein n=1 Tax=Hydrogenophaga luteola TaxID=1591122 RepID=A0ABV7W0H6_9BURK
MRTDTHPRLEPTWRFDHINVSMGSATALKALFEEVMGFAPGKRPPFPFPGTWLYEGDQALVHAVNDTALSEKAGALRLEHVAFRSDEPASDVIERLKRSSLPFKVARVPAEHVAQIFVLLPGGLVIELDVPCDVTTDHIYSSVQAAPSTHEF